MRINRLPAAVAAYSIAIYIPYIKSSLMLGSSLSSPAADKLRIAGNSGDSCVSRFPYTVIVFFVIVREGTGSYSTRRRV